MSDYLSFLELFALLPPRLPLEVLFTTSESSASAGASSAGVSSATSSVASSTTSAAGVSA